MMKIYRSYNETKGTPAPSRCGAVVDERMLWVDDDDDDDDDDDEDEDKDRLGLMPFVVDVSLVSFFMPSPVGLLRTRWVALGETEVDEVEELE
jgi:hypothetical protein